MMDEHSGKIIRKHHSKRPTIGEDMKMCHTLKNSEGNKQIE